MATLTIWANLANKIQVVQLSDDPDDGTAAQQITYLKTIAAYAGLTCVADNYQGAFPATDSAYWTWDNGQVVSAPPKLDDIITDFEKAIQTHLDVAAQLKGYDNILSACAYAGAPNPYRLEAESFVSWRGNVWAYCYGELTKVQTGIRPMPTIAQIIGELPVRLLAGVTL